MEARREKRGEKKEKRIRKIREKRRWKKRRGRKEAIIIPSVNRIAALTVSIGARISLLRREKEVMESMSVPPTNNRMAAA